MARSLVGAAVIFLLSCMPADVASSPTPQGSKQLPELATCSRERLAFLVDQFFARYNARDLDAFLALFNWDWRSSYFDNPGVPSQLNDRARLSEYLLGRWAIGDHFVTYQAAYPAGPAGPAIANPTVAFTRSFSGASQSGNAKLVCSGGFLIDVVMSSSQP